MQDVRIEGLFISASSFQVEDNSDERSLLTALSVHCSSQGRGISSDGPFCFPLRQPPTRRALPDLEGPGIRYAGAVLWAEARGVPGSGGPGGRRPNSEVNSPRPLLLHTTLVSHLTN